MGETLEKSRHCRRALVYGAYFTDFGAAIIQVIINCVSWDSVRIKGGEVRDGGPMSIRTPDGELSGRVSEGPLTDVPFIIEGATGEWDGSVGKQLHLTMPWSVDAGGPSSVTFAADTSSTPPATTALPAVPDEVAVTPTAETAPPVAVATAPEPVRASPKFTG